MEFRLLSQQEALQFIAEIGSQGNLFEIDLGEDICFGTDKWVNVGRIWLYPGGQVSETETRYDEFCAAKFGGFEWQLPTTDKLRENIFKFLDSSSYPKESVEKAFREGLQDVIRRTLLLLPVFDVETISRIPLQRPITIVTDTSAVHQGGLDFVCRFLTPWARIKVPAIVHMEILAQVDNYLSKIRWNSDNKKKAHSNPATLRQHLLSQGGQRTLLRLEFHSDAEMERGDLGADPLRGIVTSSSDSEDKALGLQNVTRSFADRLIVETARRFQTEVRPSHPLALLTSDQGMARMAMAEGIDVLFFQARSVPKFDGRTLTGTLFHPFKSTLYTVSLTTLLWELAVSFGCLRIHNPDTNASLQLWGIPSSEGVTWQPLHIKDDLLWGKFEPGTSTRIVSVQPDTSSFSFVPDVTVSKQQTSSSSPLNTDILPEGYAFSPDRMFQLIKSLVETRELTTEIAQATIGLKHQDRFNLYKNFLRSGSFIEIHDERIKSTQFLMSLWQSILSRDLTSFLNYLRKIPSFEKVYNYVKRLKVVEPHDKELPLRNKAKSTYIRLGEAACAWLNITNRGIVITDNKPELTDFANVAVEVYKLICSQGDTEWVLTGLWLEELAFYHHIHPIFVRELLEKARFQKLLDVYVEGSTPDTRFEQHNFWILKISDGIPQLEKIFLYHGDFLIPGTATVRIKVEGAKNAS
ncbi:hypothetical protein F7734_34035 [Scytonema sp. UIC 10036]|uniref:hypothetical protein n=1 Tax=Scytonema sp. UIC 10036 TaxID=2304196 RepID=UPI0012DA323B|nr:hypothetical protein [Scytonema sp. UIC 10036]MUG97089.1 hypothetical protein [Scytonema sp. UIC 10036]